MNTTLAWITVILEFHSYLNAVQNHLETKMPALFFLRVTQISSPADIASGCVHLRQRKYLLLEPRVTQSSENIYSLIMRSLQRSYTHLRVSIQQEYIPKLS